MTEESGKRAKRLFAQIIVPPSFSPDCRNQADEKNGFVPERSAEMRKFSSYMTFGSLTD
ncbi:hypothetical protein QUF80_19175 [Desulfococcaceae bacterium HSG8]|nr:hypothetical protein [Desulfococcaceae bacterium HSG8]